MAGTLGKSQKIDGFEWKERNKGLKEARGVYSTLIK